MAKVNITTDDLQNLRAYAELLGSYQANNLSIAASGISAAARLLHINQISEHFLQDEDAEGLALAIESLGRHAAVMAERLEDSAARIQEKLDIMGGHS